MTFFVRSPKTKIKKVTELEMNEAIESVVTVKKIILFSRGNNKKRRLFFFLFNNRVFPRHTQNNYSHVF